MSIAGYLVRRGPKWQVRRGLRNESGRDELGIKVEGAVLAGEKSLGERLAEDVVRAGREDVESCVSLFSNCKPGNRENALLL